MEKVKYCPICLKKHAMDIKKCDCGYEFAYVEGEDTAVISSNTVVVTDNSNEGLWKFIGFICFPVGIYFWIKGKIEKPRRSRASKKGVISFAICVGVVFLLWLIYLLLKANGRIAA